MAKKKQTKGTHGGARVNSGRYPVEDKSKAFTLQVPESILSKLKVKYPDRGELAAKVRCYMERMV
jgi:hypothetical protein